MVVLLSAYWVVVGVVLRNPAHIDEILMLTTFISHLYTVAMPTCVMAFRWIAERKHTTQRTILQRDKATFNLLLSGPNVSFFPRPCSAAG